MGCACGGSQTEPSKPVVPTVTKEEKPVVKKAEIAEPKVVETVKKVFSLVNRRIF